jgi:hypothetical protein
MRSKFLSFLVLSLILTAACSSESDPGERCDSPGGTRDVCASGTVCGKPTEKATSLTCIYICADDKDCPPNSECKGVDGTSLKGCRYKL